MSTTNNGLNDESTDIKVGMISLGCAKNLVDGEVMLGHLENSGAHITSDPSAADVVVVNTCGFITDAKRESIDSILEVAEAKRAGEVTRLVVAGCMAQAYARDLRNEIPEIDVIIGLDELENVVDAARGKLTDHPLDPYPVQLRMELYQVPQVVDIHGSVSHGFEDDEVLYGRQW